MVMRKFLMAALVARALVPAAAWPWGRHARPRSEGEREARRRSPATARTCPARRTFGRQRAAGAMTVRIGRCNQRNMQQVQSGAASGRFGRVEHDQTVEPEAGAASSRRRKRPCCQRRSGSAAPNAIMMGCDPRVPGEAESKSESEVEVRRGGNRDASRSGASPRNADEPDSNRALVTATATD